MICIQIANSLFDDFYYLCGLSFTAVYTLDCFQTFATVTPGMVGENFQKTDLSETLEYLESGQDLSVCSTDTPGKQEWMPTPQVKANLLSLNGFIGRVRGRDVSPVRSQLQLPISEISPRTSRYYKRKSRQVCDTVLECIAPGQSQALFQLMARDEAQNVDIPRPVGGGIVKRLVSLYEESNSWLIKQEVLSIFVQDYSKSQLKDMIPGLTKWRIDEARKHAALVGPGQRKEMPEIHRTRLDPVKVDHFIDFIASPNYLQDVAFGTKLLKLSNEETLEIPNVVRTVTASRLVDLYVSFCTEEQFVPLGRSTLFALLQVNWT